MTTTPVAIRGLSPDDAEAMVDLATLCEIAETGHPDPEVVDWLRAGSGEPTFCAFGVDDDTGLAAYGYVELTGGHTGVAGEVRVRPGRPLDLGVPLLARVREAAAAYDAHKPLHVFVNAGAAAQRQWWERQGAHEVRHFWRMTIDLDDDRPQVPIAPAGITLRAARADDDDLRAIYAIVESSFADHFGQGDDGTFDDWISAWRRREGFDLDLWWVAELAGAPVAVLLGHNLDVTGHVSTLGTLQQARGRGIGSLLLRTSFAQFHDRGLRRVTLGVDSENATGAVRLYESVGMHASADWALYELAPLGA